MKRAIGILLVCALAAAATVVTACKQGRGDRCQVDDDCDTGLVCNKAKNTCQSPGAGLQDAEIIDAVPDAPDAL